MAFGGWPEAALEFYVGLEADNSKSYWTSNKAVYQEKVLRPMEELVEQLAPELGEPKIFRPYRDIRFSADKTPYKTHIGATIGGTCYVQFSADGLGAGAGMWHMEPEELNRYRAAVADDPVAAWQHRADAVQDLVEARGDESFTHPYAGTHRLADAVDRFYTADIFMHTWDLSRASGQEHGLDEDFAATVLEGMRPIEEVLRTSGQYGEAVPVAADAPVVDRLMGFVGRDPAWRPAGGSAR